ncbi:DMT family transporter [Piscinibacter sp.]|uniref:DMT family transporter n=1 Tax=Piscinibacter sp. TaxID=1903157 RepID=UPI002BF4EC82|nr:DMT family transporter [Albitalea sp.]HUG23048.1 DMT family transporter [Albitalea sp.]
MTLSPRHLLLLVLLTLVWGLNWPVMKLGIGHLPPLSFRSLSMWLGLPVLYAAVRWLKVDLRVARSDWPELAKLTLTNMLVWHVIAILSLQALSSGRAAILGYTMPIFSALCGRAMFGERLTARQLGGVAAAAVGVALLLWHEVAGMAGKPWAAFGMLTAAAIWALGTQQLRRTRIAASTLALTWWMTVATVLVMTLLATAFEHDRWQAPSAVAWGTVLYNAVLIFGFAQPAWLVLARGLPPAASTLSVMMIPALGAVSGALWLGEKLHWQDAAAIVLMAVAIGTVLWPKRPPTAIASPAGPDTDRRSQGA